MSSSFHAASSSGLIGWSVEGELTGGSESFSLSDCKKIKNKKMQKSYSNLEPVEKVKLLCSFGGKIQPAPIGDKFMYSGGDSKILSVDRNVKFEELIGKVISVCRISKVSVSVKYQLPGEDLSVLISLTNDDDLEHMMVEYDRLHRDFSAVKTVRMRLFVEVVTPVLLNSGSSNSLNPDYLFGFDKESDYSTVCNDHELEHWKIPRAADQLQIPKPESDEQGGGYKGTAGDDDAVVTSQKRDGHVKSDDDDIGLPMPPRQEVIYWLPGSSDLPSPPTGYGLPANGCGYCWSESPVYVFVPSTTISRH